MIATERVSARVRRAGVGVVFVLAATLALLSMLPAGTAMALTVNGPKAVFTSAKYTVTWASDDPTGTATLYRSGVAWVKVSGAPGKTVSAGTVLFPRRALFHLQAPA